VIEIALALHHAHEAGVIHRDVKPRNVIVDLAGEPHLVDFGLAKDLPSSAHVAEDAGEVPASAEVRDLFRTLEWEDTGTLPYMPPESLVASGASIDRRFDVWSLGVTLYECLTGRLPFHAPTALETRKLIVSDAPVPPLRAANSRVSRDIEAVVLTAIEKDVARRYASALEFAEDLRRALRHEPIRARRTGLVRRAAYLVQRRTGAVLIGLLVLTVVSLGLALGLVMAQHDLDNSESRSQLKEDNLMRRLRATPVAIAPPEVLARRESLAFERVPRMIAASEPAFRLVAHFPFDGDLEEATSDLEGAFSEVDYVFSGASGFVPTPSGLSGAKRALKPDGDRFVEIPDSPVLDLESSFSIDLWIHPEAVGGCVLMKGVVCSGGAPDHNYSVDLVEGSDGGAGLLVRFGFVGLGGEQGSVPSIRPLDLLRWNHVRCRLNQDYPPLDARGGTIHANRS